MHASETYLEMSRKTHDDGSMCQSNDVVQDFSPGAVNLLGDTSRHITILMPPAHSIRRLQQAYNRSSLDESQVSQILQAHLLLGVSNFSFQADCEDRFLGSTAAGPIENTTFTPLPEISYQTMDGLTVRIYLSLIHI